MRGDMQVRFGGRYWETYGRKTARRPIPSLRTSEGGSVIDLLMKIENCSFYDAISRLAGCTNIQSNQQLADCMYKRKNVETVKRFYDDDFSFHRIQITKIQSVNHKKIIAWIRERKINLDLANLYCKEIHYRNRNKQYFSIGFRNNKGGYELNSPPSFKSCIPPKEITTFRNGNDTCLVFEGFWDFLSYLTIRKIERTKNDVAVLNSVANVQKAMDFLKSHKEIYTYLDNDESGRKATGLIKSANATVYNQSTQFTEYKDLNDYLRGKKQIIETSEKRGLKI